MRELLSNNTLLVSNCKQINHSRFALMIWYPLLYNWPPNNELLLSNLLLELIYVLNMILGWFKYSWGPLSFSYSNIKIAYKHEHLLGHLKIPPMYGIVPFLTVYIWAYPQDSKPWLKNPVNYYWPFRGDASFVVCVFCHWLCAFC